MSKMVVSGGTAEMSDSFVCKDCGWPVVDACCNGKFEEFVENCPGADGPWDWWYYCSNKGCKNHVGEGVSQKHPDWLTDSVDSLLSQVVDSHLSKPKLGQWLTRLAERLVQYVHAANIEEVMVVRVPLLDLESAAVCLTQAVTALKLLTEGDDADSTIASLALQKMAQFCQRGAS